MINKEIKKHIKNGVLFLDEKNVIVDESVQIEKGVVVGPGVSLRGKTKICSNSEITGESCLENAIIGENVKIKSSYIADSEIGKNTTVGPFANIKQNSRIGQNCRIGNYVEIKNSILGNFTKAAHLAYIGDAEVGNKVNIGCGVVFANYNGKIKNRTLVGDNVFIGCNCNLVAPLRIKDNCYIAAGTTVTKNVDENLFCIGRVVQETKKIEDCDFLK